MQTAEILYFFSVAPVEGNSNVYQLFIFLMLVAWAVLFIPVVQKPLTKLI